jgi:hypothetical protein
VTEEKYPLLRASGQYLAPIFSRMSVPGGVTYRLAGSFWEHSDDIVKAKVCDAQITHKGINPFAEVLDGFAILEGPLISATLSDRQSGSDRSDSDIAGIFSKKTLLCDLNYQSNTELGYMDLPLVIGNTLGVAGMITPIAKRSSQEDVITHWFEDVSWILSKLFS